MRLRLAVAMAALATACSSSPTPGPPSILDFLPPLPPAGGPALAQAGVVTPENRAAKTPAGDAAKGVPGDFYLQNDKIRLLVQAPGRAGELLGFGGNAMNLDLLRSPGDPGRTQFGEIAPFFNVAHTANFTRVEVVRDGKSGGPAVIRAIGHAAVLDYFNLAGFVRGLDLLGFDPDEPPPLDVAATYILEPGDSHVRVVYTLFNRSDEEQEVAIGTFADSGGDIEFFTAGAGFGSAKFTNLAGILSDARSTDYWAAQSSDGAFAVVPAAYGPTRSVPNASLLVSGVAVMVYDANGLLEAVSGSRFTVPAKSGRSYETYLVMGTDLADVHAQILKLRGLAGATVSGRVRSLSGDPVAGARVAVVDGDGAVVTTATSAADGTWRATVAPGTYTLQADKIGWPRSASASVTVAANGSATADFTLAPPARLPYTVTDGMGRPLPAKLTFVGEDPSPPDRRFFDLQRDPLDRGLSRVVYTLLGSSDADGVIEIEPGEYRVVVTRGNEYSRFDQRLTLAPGDNARLSVTLHRVLDTAGYVKGDFHQHGVNSPDATTPMRDRVITYLAAGIEYVGSSDHDYHTDYGPTIRALGMQDQIGSMVGVESTPFDYGHFNAFPLPSDPNHPSRGALDWGDGERTNLSPGRMFGALRRMGAQVVQVNHARSTSARSVPAAGFQAYFDRAALTFDLVNGTFFGDTANQPLPNDVLRIALDEPLWSDDFDTLEIYNGFEPAAANPDGSLGDRRVELLVRDWFNFLSMGKIVTPIGNSDSHNRTNTVDAPFTYVRVPDDTRPGMVREQDVLDAMKSSRDVVVTNGPFLTLHINEDDRPAMGRTITDTDGTVELTVKVQAPAWMPVDRVLIFSNNSYRIPPPGPEHDPMSPVAVVRLSETPGTGEVRLSRVTVAPGAERLEATVVIPRFALPTAGKDAWIVAAVRGSQGLYPWVSAATPSTVPVADLQSGAFTGGVLPLAITSAAFVDRDGNGRYDAPLGR